MQGYFVGEVTPSFEAWAARVHPDDRAEAIALIDRARDRRETYIHEFRSLHPGGAIRWCSARGSFLYDASGAPYRMIGLMEDITDRKLAEDAIGESEERFRQFAHASSGALWIRKADTLGHRLIMPQPDADGCELD
ncbi:PAS domain-containing protein [Novosphingobium sp. ZW T3_23]|uniref:PAS domain-containing protein n=1 Tax=Novosphingobium sp. ZW T3_23 TaxID=3378084 RepID=UPI0038528184